MVIIGDNYPCFAYVLFIDRLTSQFVFYSCINLRVFPEQGIERIPTCIGVGALVLLFLPERRLHLIQNAWVVLRDHLKHRQLVSHLARISVRLMLLSQLFKKMRFVNASHLAHVD